MTRASASSRSLAGEIRELHAVARDDRHLLVVEKHDVARVLQDGRDVGRDEKLAVAEPTTTGGPLRTATIFSGSSADSSTIANSPRSRSIARSTACSRPSPCHSCSTRCATTSVSVSVTNVWPCALQLALQLEVVLDDAVVDDDDPAGAVAVRVRVLFGRPAVRGPARVAEAVEPVERLAAR